MEKTIRLTVIGCLGIILALSLCLPAYAQRVPDSSRAGVIERTLAEMDRKIQAQEEEEPLPEVESSRVDLSDVDEAMEETLLRLERKLEQGKEEYYAAPTVVSFLVSEFNLVGNSVISTAELNRLLKNYTGRSVTIDDLRDACDSIAALYKIKGFFLAKAYLPAQDIDGGIVTIEIIEGRLGRVSVEGEGHYDIDFVRNNFHPDRGGVVNYGQILKSLLLLNEYTGLKAKAVLQRGQEPYTVDVVLKVEDRLPLAGLVEFDNFGSRYVSRHRVASELEYNDLLLGGDRIFLRGVSGTPEDTLKCVKSEYSFPLNHSGTRASLSYSWSDLNVQREFRLLDAAGTSKIYSLLLSHPVTRSRSTLLDYVFGFDYKQIKNYLMNTLTSDDELRVFKTGVSGEHAEASGKAKNYFSFLVSSGIDGIMGGLKHDDLRASRLGAGGEFIRTNFDFARLQKVAGDSYLLMRCASQMASDTLPISEQFSVGGADSVRGYPEAELLGDSGFIGSFELRMPPPVIADTTAPLVNKKYRDMVQLVGFIDYGKSVLKNPLAGESKSSDISGGGFGTRFNLGGDLYLRLEMGFPFETPADGSNSRFYFKALKKF